MDHRMLDVPTIDAGGSFGLRPWRLGDVALVAEASRDAYIPLVTTVPAEYSEAAGRAFVERQWGRVTSGAGYPFVIVRTADERPVGFIGLWLKDLAEGRASLGYWVVDSARGQGAAAAALRAATQWGIRELGIPRLELCIEPWNAASVRTAERAGFRRERLLPAWQLIAGERRDMVLYSLLEADLS